MATDETSGGQVNGKVEPESLWFSFSEDSQGIHYAETRLPGAFGALVALICLTFPVSELHGMLFSHSEPNIAHDRPAPFFGVIMIVGFITFTIFIVVAWLQPQRLTFGREARRLTGVSHGFFNFLTRVDISLDQRNQVYIRGWSDDDNTQTFVISVNQFGYRVVQIGGWKDRAAAEAWLTRIQDLISDKPLAMVEIETNFIEHPSQGTET